MNWNDRTLGEISDEVDGVIQTGPFGSQLHESDYVKSGVPVVMPKNIIDGRVSTEGIACISERDAKRLERHLLDIGDIVYGRRGDIGRRALIRERERGWLCGTGCLRLSLGSTVLDPVYLYYYLGQTSVIDWISNQAIGATLPNLNTGILRSVPIRYPPPAVQKRIASILSSYDDLIENNTRRITILEEMAQMIYREWFVNLRFRCHEKVRMVKSELGQIPEDWRVERLDKLARITMGQSPPSEYYNTEGKGLPFHQGVTDFGALFPENLTYCTLEQRIAEAGDILLSVRAPVGRLNITLSKIVIGRGLCAVKSLLGWQPLLFQQLRDRFHEEDTMGSGTIFKAVTKEDICGLRFLCPEASIGERFTELISPMFEELEVLSAQTSNLRQTRDFLLPKLISGQVSVEYLETAAQVS